MFSNGGCWGGSQQKERASAVIDRRHCTSRRCAAAGPKTRSRGAASTRVAVVERSEATDRTGGNDSRVCGETMPPAERSLGSYRCGCAAAAARDGGSVSVASRRSTTEVAEGNRGGWPGGESAIRVRPLTRREKKEQIHPDSCPCSSDLCQGRAETAFRLVRSLTCG